MFIVTPIVGVCNCSMFCCTLLYVHSSIAIILMGTRELIALLNLSSWCLVMVERLFFTVPRGCLQFVIVVFPDHTYLLFLVRFNQTCRELLCRCSCNIYACWPSVTVQTCLLVECCCKMDACWTVATQSACQLSFCHSILYNY